MDFLTDLVSDVIADNIIGALREADEKDSRSSDEDDDSSSSSSSSSSDSDEEDDGEHDDKGRSSSRNSLQSESPVKEEKKGKKKKEKKPKKSEEEVIAAQEEELAESAEEEAEFIIPPSGMRIPLDANSPFPDTEDLHDPPFFAEDGTTPIYIGSAILETGIHPCKISTYLPTGERVVSVAYQVTEIAHSGRYDLLPFDPDQMEWVETASGRVPEDRQPVEGGYEGNGARLYHGCANANGFLIPGKCGEHLNGCVVSYRGAQYTFIGHQILCWKSEADAE